MKKSILSVVVVLVVVFISSPVLSEGLKFGIGASATSSSSTIYFPIKSKSFIIEPMISLRQTEYDSKSTTLSRSMEGRQFIIGAGFFRYSGVLEKVDLIYGLRLGYLKTQTDEKQVQGLNVATSDQELTGYLIAPTASIEYNFNNHISAGCTISIEYEKLTGDENVNQGSEVKFDIDTKDYTTKTDLFIKYYF